MEKKSLIYLLFGLVLLAGAIFLGSIYSSTDVAYWQNRITEQLHIKENAARKKLEFLQRKYEHYGNADSLFVNELMQSKLSGAEFIIVKDSMPVFWTENYVPVPETGANLHDISVSDTVVTLKNGVYFVVQKKNDSVKYVAYILIKKAYNYQNDYLENDFSAEFGSTEGISISFNKNGKDIFDSNGNYLFSITIKREELISCTEAYILFVMYVTSFLLFLAALYSYYKKYLHLFRSRLLFNLIYAADLLVIRLLLYYFKIPSILYTTQLFSPDYYASSWLFPSLGDLFVNIIVLLVIFFLLFRSISIPDNVPGKMKHQHYFSAIVLVFIAGFIFKLIDALIGSIVLDSDVNFGLNNIFNLEFAGFIGLTTIAASLLIFFLISSKIIEYFVYVFRQQFVAGLIVLILSTSAYFVLLPEPAWVYYLFLLTYFVILYSVLQRKQGYLSASAIFAILVLYSLATTYEVNAYQKKRTLENQQLIVDKMKNPYNPVLEYLYDQKRKEIAEIDVQAVETEDYEAILEDSVLMFFNEDIWQNYDVFVTVCNDRKDLLIQPEDILINCSNYFSSVVDEIGESTDTKNFYIIEENSLNESYLGIIKLGSNLHVYIEILSKFIPQGLGYPELLVNKENELNPFIKDHSIAKYKESKLVYRFGNYQYSINFMNYALKDKMPVDMVRNEYHHYFYRLDGDEILVISKPEVRFLEYIAPFSYLLIIFSLFLLIFGLTTTDWKVFFHIAPTLRKRLQFSIITIVFVTFLFIGALSVWYIIQINTDKNLDTLKEKSHSVLIELEHKLAENETIEPALYPYIYEILGKFSQVFFSDINLFNLDGFLIASSRPNIFTEGLISSRIDENAYNKILIENKMLHIQKERIGSYEYLSAYLPFRNDDNRIIAVLNLPYFAKQDELKTEISTFLTAFINIYVIIFVISVLITILISQKVTKPLQLLRSKIGKVQLGKMNEKIKWKGNDEIAGLVNEYNRMIDELEKNAELLARSERESAWREMAKQVAHEIKNPLTPMKLSIQHLKRMIHDRSDEWEKNFDRISNMLIEQIDSLSTIASEFSDFAKMPVGKKRKIELCSTLESTAGLFQTATDIEFSVDLDNHEPCYVIADRKQLMRAFNNLIENSIQALENREHKKIAIQLHESAGEFIIRFTDNGSGIDPSIADKIFSPRFTTKTSGMGLGLAMVQSIIHDSGGTINFESEPGKGTTFIIALPKHSE